MGNLPKRKPPTDFCFRQQTTPAPHSVDDEKRSHSDFCLPLSPCAECCQQHHANNPEGLWQQATHNTEEATITRHCGSSQREALWQQLRVSDVAAMLQ